ncbi:MULTISPECIES: ATP-dependent helicase [Bradyrhizobium]|uniref:DNA 3'-5' helicase n=1 Tax=Bradyrhizobium yuanmingense TaxID=108015 RepID=A0A1C3WW07_9BRAD|nr:MULTISPECIES: UvrD-helicase domain-containing protein [Bradyrhizobium]MCA1476981.1 UvrD-helicase domain-containing protein [Bradyrhizobium sp. NBAIM08]TWI23635.1 Rep family ATP-dependent DNA helicase [Bradyrhizobium yuanmingense]SCB44160.1 ATP-dependent DNA helicase, Rep family [Bradyrhizobium yuanmingense]
MIRMTEPSKITAVPDHQPAAGGIAARARASVGPKYLAGLNPEQREAVETLDGPVLVLAGAGTGKTRVLTTRIAHILSQGRARPAEILSVTFTNKAAREMKHRLSQMLGHAVEGMPWLGTFHSIGGRILRIHAELAQLKSNFTVLDVDDQVRLLKQLLQAENIDEKRWPARMLAGLIDGWKNRGLMPSQVPSGEAAMFANGKGGKLYASYQERLKILNAADFGDLLLENIRIFREHPDILRQYQQRFKFILVDEYQDTNVAQYLWLRLLSQAPSSTSPRLRGEVASRSDAGEGASPSTELVETPPHPGLLPASGEKEKTKNICCVGDDDQSIYGWRGAEVDNILRFEHDFPGAKVIRLERNYRSTGHILAAASHLIAHNEGRLGKTLRTEDQDGEKVTVTGSWDSEEEARGIGEEIEQLQRQGEKLNEIAILVRASYQMREFEDRFVTLGLPYRVIGGPRFYERAEIRDALAYLRVINSPADDLAFERIVNTPKRGLGDATVQMLHDHARKRRIPLFEAARAVVETDELKPKARGSLRDLIVQFDRWRAQREVTAHTDLAQIVLDESGYTEMWQKDRSADAAGRLENLKELVRSMEEFENLQGFLEHISLVMDREGGAEDDAVSLMTLHSAKGLEFDNVFLPGWEEGLFPSQRTLDEQGRAGLEEERRLGHVGLTRARRRAKIYFATNRRIHGTWSTTIPSRFLDELPAANVEITESKGGSGWGGSGGYGASRFDDMEAFGSSYSTPGWQRAQANRNRGGGRSGGFEEEAATFSTSSSSGPDFGSFASRRRGPLTIEGELVAKSTGTTSEFSLEDRVFHQKFGYGRVTKIDGNKLTIAFDKAGEKKVVDSFVQRA